MKLHDLKPANGSSNRRKRLGRGTSSGVGKTCGKGHKGQNARSGGGVRPGFEGGQVPLHRRIPKRGFSNVRFAAKYALVNLDKLNSFKAGTTVDAEKLIEANVIKNSYDGVKILAKGDLSKKLTIKAVKFSKTAIEKIEAAGGKAEVV